MGEFEENLRNLAKMPGERAQQERAQHQENKEQKEQALQNLNRAMAQAVETLQAQGVPIASDSSQYADSRGEILEWHIDEIPEWLPQGATIKFIWKNESQGSIQVEAPGAPNGSLTMSFSTKAFQDRDTIKDTFLTSIFTHLFQPKER